MIAPRMFAQIAKAVIGDLLIGEAGNLCCYREFTPDDMFGYCSICSNHVAMISSIFFTLT